MSAAVNPLSDEERLERFETLTDATLAYLGAEELLVELLDELREALKADVAVAFLVDSARTHLVTAVVRGFREAGSDAVGSVRVRLGEGVVGRIAADQEAVAFPWVGADDRRDPVVRESEVASLLGVPLVSQGVVSGVLLVGSFTAGRHSVDDLELMQSATDRTALAIEVRSSNAQLSAAVMLQRSLIPPRLPPVAGLTTAARYVPGGGGAVGGDWYDMFTLPAGHVAFAVGDVVGHGLHAAVVMGRLRSALRAYALGSLDPAEVLTQLNRKLRHFERSQMATLLYGVLDPLLGRVRLSSAGHPPAMMAAPGRSATDVEVPPDLPLGVSSDSRRRAATVDLPPGGLLCAYTDGLIERRGEHLDEGLTRLRDVLVPCDPEDLCDEVMTTLLGRRQPTDDVALLVVKREDVQDHNVLVVPAERSAPAQVRVALRRWLAPTGASRAAVGELLVAVSEAVSNSVEHAYGPAGGVIEVSMQLDHDQVVATIRDNGSWRPHREHTRGRGMLLIRALSDQVDIDTATTGTRVTIRRRLRQEDDP